MNEMPSVLPGRSSSLQGGRVHPDLEALLVLQDKDVAVASCDARLKALEPEIRQLDEQIAAAERAGAQAQAGGPGAGGRAGGGGGARAGGDRRGGARGGRGGRKDSELSHEGGAAPPATRVGARGEGSV